MHQIIERSYRDNFRKTVLDIVNPDLLYFYSEATHVLVSMDGRVFNAKTKRQYKSHKNQNGYDAINVVLTSGRRKAISVHRIVAETFLAYLDHSYYEVNHIDGNKSNNHLNNLEWMTRQENLEHARKNRLCRNLSGENSNSAKFSNQDVRDMREFHLLGFKNIDIVRAYGIDRNYLTAILNEKARKL